jgi:hypothetical protein
VTISAVVGCGRSNSQAAKTTPSTAAATTEPQRSPQEQQIVDVARQFLDAVIQGDSERAIGQMTPQAVEQMRSSREAFSPPSWETAKYRTGQVRMPSPEQAIVQCYFTETTPSGNRQEEMCCMLKRVDGRWGVSGVAFQLSPTQPPYILDFEKPPQTGPTQQHMAEFPTTPPSAIPPATATPPAAMPPTEPDRYRTAQPQPPAVR